MTVIFLMFFVLTLLPRFRQVSGGSRPSPTGEWILQPRNDIFLHYTSIVGEKSCPGQRKELTYGQYNQGSPPVFWSFAFGKREILLLALVMGGATLWADVNSCVAAYNVRAWQTGKLDTVDVDYLRCLGSGAVPWLEELAGSDDPEVAQEAREALKGYYVNQEGFRDWNFTDAKAADIIQQFKP